MQYSVFENDNDLNDLQSRIYKVIPKQTQDIVGTAVFLIGLPIGFLIHIFGIMPTWYPAFGEAWMIRVSLLLVLASNVYMNWYKMLIVGPNGNAAVLPNIVKSGFRYCHSCRKNVPPRTYHCPVCNVCCMRRDHHCSFGGVCVGHFNQRYFFSAVVNLWILCVPLLSYVWDFTWMCIEGGFTLGKTWQIMLPHLALMARVINFTQFLYILFCAFTFTSLLFVTYLLIAQLFCLWNGQTRMEYLMDIQAYHLGFVENMRHALGSRWFLVAVSPFVPSPLPSDGMTFVTRELLEHNNPKHM
uniref:Palmitoyltransferase n=1 Tax=Heterorhabditis bacteriophora TaxID=37862 RepID=A0A1I7XW12_HETBA